VDYPLPGNDDAIRAIRIFTRFVSDTLLASRAEAQEGADVVETAAAEAAPPEASAAASA
jgi:small subunit ribosomal protein S2